MKREFGKKLIEEFIPRWDLTHVIDTAGAYIPGHGTPTVILFGKHQSPVAPTIRTVMGIKGEPATPDDPTHGLVWNAILAQVDEPGSQSEFVSVGDTARESFHKHPWSIGGGGAAELKEMLGDAGNKKLDTIASQIGITGATGEDDLFLLANAAIAVRLNIERTRAAVLGDEVRDWCQNSSLVALWPYEVDFKVLPLARIPRMARLMWPARCMISRRKPFGIPILQRGMSWYEWQELYTSKLQTPLTITYAEVATHNHFFLERGGKVFNRTAPVIKLPVDATVADHIAIVGLLNSSTTCFWLKQVCQNKGSTVDQHGARQRTAPFEDFFVFNGTKFEQFPVPDEKPLSLAQELDRHAQELMTRGPAAALATNTSHNRAALDAAKKGWTEALQRMIVLQEELDWECYQLYGLTSIKLILPSDQVPRIQLGERAFEIVMARKLAAGELQTTWFGRHRSAPITELPAHWPQPYRELVQRRIALIESDRNIALIEQPEYKRRWNVEPWDEQLERALREWLLNRLEGYFFEGERILNSTADGADSTDKNNQSESIRVIREIRGSFPAGVQPALVSTNQLAAVVETDADFLRVAEIYSGGPGFSVSKLVRELVEAESVPFLPFQRYKDTGLRKRQDWEHVWALQRKEDAIEAEVRGRNPAVSEEEIKELTKKRQREEVGDIPVPPKYASGDFKKSNWWKLRGKLDVPKERWIIYPGAEREGDPSPVIAWAGWDHLQQAKALAEYYVDAGQNRGWEAEKLKPLLAGLAELLPWLKQWHNEFNSDVGMGFSDYIAGFLEDEARKQGTTVEALNRFSLGLAG